MSSPHSQRDNAQTFDPKTFYTFHNSNAPQSTLSAGIYTNTNGALNMTTNGAYSSENWQFFPQSGRYFIRNYDYGANWQLGISPDSRSIPRLYPRSGSVSQQWSLTAVAGGWELVNGLWGTGMVLALPSGWGVPAMRSEKDGSVWNITSNESAAQSKPPTADMLSSVAGFENQDTVVSSTSSESVGTSTWLAHSTSVIPVSNRQSQIASSTSIPSSTPPTFSGGAIAGTVVGAVAFLASVVFALWVILARKRKDQQSARDHGTPYEVEAVPAGGEKYARFASEMDTGSGISELAEMGMVYELGSGSDRIDSMRKK